MSELTRAEKKNLIDLQTKKGRKEQGLFIAEGITLIGDALRFGGKPDVIYYSEVLLNPRGQRLLAKLRRSGLQTVPLAAQDLTKVSDAETCQGLLGVFKVPNPDLSKIVKQDSRILVLDNISDPGNAGTLIRSAAAFQFAAVAVTNYSVEPYNPKVVRSSAGTIFAIPTAVVTVEEIIAVKQQWRFPLITADLRGTYLRNALRKVDSRKGLMLAIGAETAGISKKLDSIADIRIRIKHASAVDSLNAAVAGSIIMKEVYEL